MKRRIDWFTIIKTLAVALILAALAAIVADSYAPRTLEADAVMIPGHPVAYLAHNLG